MTWVVLAIAAAGFLAAVIAVVSVSISLRRSTDAIITAIASLPTPTVPAEPLQTIVKYVPVDAPSMRTPRGIVMEWAAEMKKAGIEVTQEEIDDQIEAWSQNEELI